MSYPWYVFDVTFADEEPIKFEATGMTVGHAMEELIHDLQREERYPEHHGKDIIAVSYVECLLPDYDPITHRNAEIPKALGDQAIAPPIILDEMLFFLPDRKQSQEYEWPIQTLKYRGHWS